MRGLQLLFIGVLLSSVIYSQPVTGKYLDANSVKARIENGGKFFNNSFINLPGYEVPNGENTFTVFFSSFLFGALDENEELHGSFTDFHQNSDIFSGPYSTNNSYDDPAYSKNYHGKIWKVSKEEIIYHIDNHSHPNYQAPEGIADWPGNGDVNLGIANQLAPYVDVNNDGEYNPDDGDYPCIKGDQAAFVILNDDAKQQKYASKNLGIEVHLMFYQFKSNDFLDTTTFINAKIFNRSENDYSNFKTSLFVDASIGFPFAQFAGCDTTRNLGYAYKTENYDEGSTNSLGFGENPPSLGTLLLNDTISSFGLFYNPYGFQPWPVSENSFWNLMNGRWTNGNKFVVGGSGHAGSNGATTQETNFLFPGNPYLDQGWTEMNVDGNGTTSFKDEDRLYLQTTSKNEFNQNDVIEYDYAFLFSRVGDSVENVQGVIDLADVLQEIYDDSLSLLSCEQQGTGIMDSIPPLEGSQKPYPKLFEITRLDGKGNMGLPVKISPSSENQILAQNQVDSVRYQLGYGPIHVERIDSVNFKVGYYVIKILENDIDDSDWRIYRYHQQGGQLLDSADANTDLMQGDTVYFNQYGLKIAIQQKKYPCFDNSSSCFIHKKLAPPIHSEMRFSDTSKVWLTGVKDNLGYNVENWIKTGNDNIDPDLADPNLGFNNPHCYSSNNIVYDYDLLYSNLIGGIISPSFFTRYRTSNYCQEMKPIQIPTQASLSPSLYTGINNNNQPTVFHPNIDIVITDDSSRWTRCPVIELNHDSLTSVGHAYPGLLRQSPSVDKLGNPDNSGTNGMSWFPGYAIDVETGRRLNMAFGENSTLSADNGTDMIWNPSDRIYDSSGDPVLGGQHMIYVFGGQFDDMPNYDEGEFIYEKLNNFNISNYRAVYRNLSWVMSPILASGYDLLDTRTRIEVRLNNEFDHYELSNENESRPMFGFRVGEYDPFLELAEQEEIQPQLFVFPNPARNVLNIRWENLKEENIIIYSIDGKLIEQRKVDTQQSELKIDISKLKNGVYIIQKGGVSKKFVKG